MFGSRSQGWGEGGLKSPNGRDVTKRAIIDVNSVVSGRNYDILTSITASAIRRLGPMGASIHSEKMPGPLLI